MISINNLTLCLVDDNCVSKQQTAFENTLAEAEFAYCVLLILSQCFNMCSCYTDV